MRRVKARMEAISRKSRNGVESWLREMPNCTVFQGTAQFTAPSTVRVGPDELQAGRIFINVGGRAVVPPFPGVDQVRALTNTTILQLDEVPRHLVIIGGSYVGLEFAQAFRRFGAEVTVIEKGPRLLGREDADIANAITKILQNEQIEIRCDAECIRLEPRGADIAVTVGCASGPPESVGSHVLLAVGRRPNTDDLGLERAGVATDDHGYITVDDELRTSAPGIWALGDCNGRGAFTHTSYNDYEIVAANLLDGQSRGVRDRVPGYALYIDPPLGRAGMTEAEARAKGYQVRIGSRPMTRVARAVEKGETQGLMKIVVDGATDAILGAAVLGPGGDEAIHAILGLMTARATATTLQHTVPIHPTVSELLPALVSEL
jgi:pyruvate/2-oxoglutarate dehydrogenase complex dihydrolipoamide dehydrogenase (E3) component